MAKVSTRRPTDEIVEDASDVVAENHLFKTVFRRVRASVTEGAPKQRMFITFGTSEEDAIDRVWNCYRGTSFQKDFAKDQATAELILGDVQKIGG